MPLGERIAEMVEDEAAAAEAGEFEPASDTEAEFETPPEPEPEPKPADDEKAIRKATESLDREDERHRKRYREVMGEAADDLLDCPLCWRPGFIFPPDAMQPETEIQAELLTVLTRAAGTVYNEAPDTRPCETCGALGQVLTGSKAAGHELKNCTTCGGIGWLSKPAPAPEPYQDPANGWTPPAVVAQPAAGYAADQWGRAPGHPDYGRDPATTVMGAQS